MNASQAPQKWILSEGSKPPAIKSTKSIEKAKVVECSPADTSKSGLDLKEVDEEPLSINLPNPNPPKRQEPLDLKDPTLL